MTKDNGIRLVHAGDLTTTQAIALTWKVGSDGHRYQEIAIHGAKVVGSWRYEPETKGKSWRIDSEYTEVARGYQRRGLAVRLWMHGIARWRPTTRITARIGSSEGKCFLAWMTAELAHAHPSLFLDVTNVKPEEIDDWISTKWWAAQRKLEQLGKAAATAAPKQKQLPAPAPLALKAAS